jgi:hypothetical protein
MWLTTTFVARSDSMWNPSRWPSCDPTGTNPNATTGAIFVVLNLDRHHDAVKGCGWSAGVRKVIGSDADLDRSAGFGRGADPSRSIQHP